MKSGIFKSSLIKNLFYLYGSYFARYLFPLAVIPFLARILEPDLWGEILFTQSFSLYVSLIVEFGFGLSATRDISKYKDDSNVFSAISGNVFSCQLLLALVLIPLTMPFLFSVKVFILNPDYYFLGLFSGLFQGLNLFWFFKGMERMKYVAMVEFFTRLVATLGIFVFIKHAEDAWIVLFSNLIANLMTFSLGFLYLKKIIRLRLTFSKKLISTFKVSSRFFLVRAGAGLFSMGLVFICGIYLPPASVAFFTGAEKIISTVRLLLTPAIDALFPRISYLIVNEPGKGLLLIRKSFYLMSFVGLILSLLVFLFSADIIYLILGSGYQDSILILKILSPLPIIY